jgi:hypothetical protein
VSDFLGPLYGSLGNTYVGTEADNFSLNLQAGVESTSTVTFTEISQGSAPNFLLHAVFHITITPNGTVTSYVDNFTVECRG